jgi:nitrate reductase cytochrome c-type subunit
MRWEKGRLLLLLAIGIVMAGSILGLQANKAYGLDEHNCLTCHGSPELVKTGPNGEKISLYVNEERVNTAAHRFIDCTTCH